jgi:hypothetical protein
VLNHSLFGRVRHQPPPTRVGSSQTVTDNCTIMSAVEQDQINRGLDVVRQPLEILSVEHPRLAYLQPGQPFQPLINVIREARQLQGKKESWKTTKKINERLTIIKNSTKELYYPTPQPNQNQRNSRHIYSTTESCYRRTR